MTCTRATRGAIASASAPLAPSDTPSSLQTSAVRLPSVHRPCAAVRPIALSRICRRAFRGGTTGGWCLRPSVQCTRLLLGPDGSATRRAVSTPQVPRRLRYESRGRRLASGAMPNGSRGVAPRGPAAPVSSISRHHDLRLPDPRVPQGSASPNYAALSAALGVRLRALARGVPPASSRRSARCSARRVRAGVGGAPVVAARRRPGGAFSVVHRGRDPRPVADHRDRAATSSTVTYGLGRCACVVALLHVRRRVLARARFAGVGRFGAYGLSLRRRVSSGLLPCIPLAHRRRHQPGLVRRVPRGTAAASRPTSRCAGDRGLAVPGPCGAVVGLSSNLGLSCSAGRCSRRC